MADNLGRLELVPFGGPTTARLEEMLRASRIDSVVDVHNPLDLTPMAGDAAYEEAVRAVLDDPAVDVGVVGMVPLTVAMNTLPAGDGHREDVTREDSSAGRMIRIMRESTKAWVAIVDAGAPYDPFVRLLEAGGVPTFRSADTALRLLNLFVARRQQARELRVLGT